MNHCFQHMENVVIFSYIKKLKIYGGPWYQPDINLPNWYHLGNNTCYLPKVSKFYIENDIYVYRLEMQK